MSGDSSSWTTLSVNAVLFIKPTRVHPRNAHLATIGGASMITKRSINKQWTNISQENRQNLQRSVTLHCLACHRSSRRRMPWYAMSTQRVVSVDMFTQETVLFAPISSQHAIVYMEELFCCRRLLCLPIIHCCNILERRFLEQTFLSEFCTMWIMRNVRYAQRLDDALHNACMLDVVKRNRWKTMASLRTGNADPIYNQKLGSWLQLTKTIKPVCLLWFEIRCRILRFNILKRLAAWH
jgi:hypothetical protein